MTLQIKALWHCNWYDGPIDGVCLYGDRVAWFVVSHDDDDDWLGEYDILVLSPDEINHEITKHMLFRQHVSCWSDFGDSYSHANQPREEWEKFYSKYPPDLEAGRYQNNKVLTTVRAEDIDWGGR
jgi:hypothetical protein